MIAGSTEHGNAGIGRGQSFHDHVLAAEIDDAAQSVAFVLEHRLAALRDELAHLGTTQFPAIQRQRRAAIPHFGDRDVGAGIRVDDPRITGHAFSQTYDQHIARYAEVFDGARQRE